MLDHMYVCVHICMDTKYDLVSLCIPFMRTVNYALRQAIVFRSLSAELRTEKCEVRATVVEMGAASCEM